MIVVSEAWAGPRLVTLSVYVMMSPKLIAVLLVVLRIVRSASVGGGGQVICVVSESVLLRVLDSRVVVVIEEVLVIGVVVQGVRSLTITVIVLLTVACAPSVPIGHVRMLL